MCGIVGYWDKQRGEEMSIVEQMAVGIPCVATDVEGSALIIGECGVVVPSKDKVVLALELYRY